MVHIHIRIYIYIILYTFGHVSDIPHPLRIILLRMSLSSGDNHVCMYASHECGTIKLIIITTNNYVHVCVVI